MILGLHGFLYHGHFDLEDFLTLVHVCLDWMNNSAIAPEGYRPRCHCGTFNFCSDVVVHFVLADDIKLDWPLVVERQ